MSQKKNIIIGAALAGLSVGMLSISTNVSAADDIQCWGTNSKASCGVEMAQIEAANKEFKNEFKSSEPHKCKNHAKDGNLNWTKVKSNTECKTLGGFLMDKKGKITKNAEIK